MTERPATSSWPHRESTPQRIAILSAADRLLTGTPARSTGNLSVVQLAIEADVKYWVAAQKHTDLREHFQRLVAQNVQADNATHGRGVDTLVRLQREHRQLTKHCAQLEDLLRTYAVVINELSLENEAIRDQPQRDSVRRLEAPRTRRI